MNVPDLTASEYLASADYDVGTEFPLLEITKVEKKPAPNGKGSKAVLHMAKAPKPIMVSSNQVLRQLGEAFGRKNIDKEWVGCKVAWKVVGDVRRPDGTKGNAFRIAKTEPKKGA